MITAEQWQELATRNNHFYYVGYNDVEVIAIGDGYSYRIFPKGKDGKCYATIIRTIGGVYPFVSIDGYSAEDCYFTFEEAKKDLEKRKEQRRIEAVKEAEEKLERAKKALENGEDEPSGFLFWR